MDQKIYKKIQTKMPLLLFAIVVVFAASGTASAQVDPNAQITDDVFVVDSGETFSGSTAIQDSIDSPNTVDGSYVVLNPGNYTEQVTISKNLYIVGIGSKPEDTTIQFNTDGDVITVPDGVSVTLKNIAITNLGNGYTISLTGSFNLINCVLTESYVEPDGESTPEMAMASDMPDTEITSELETQSTMITEDATSDLETTILTLESTSTTPVVGETENNIIEPTTTETSLTTPVVGETENNIIEPTTTETNENTAPDGTDIPLTTMAYGMLMVVGGVVFQRKNDVRD